MFLYLLVSLTIRSADKGDVLQEQDSPSHREYGARCRGAQPPRIVEKKLNF